MYLKDDEIQKEQQEENGVERRQVLTQYGEDLGMGGGRERYIGCDAHYSKTHSVGDHVCGLDIREQKSGYIEATVGEGGQKVAVEQHQVVLVDGRGNVVLLAGEDMLDPVRHLGVREEGGSVQSRSRTRQSPLSRTRRCPPRCSSTAQGTTPVPDPCRIV